ncbi:MAG TPA: LysE family translocator [Gaiellaceae bacterium]|nr:LysE family translocator [Gaiellaceae bacterium]
MIGFVLLAAVVICTPGPDTALTIRNTLLGGRGNGLRTAQGVAVGQALWTLAASVGIAALVAASQPVFTAVRIAGVAYLVWLGLQSLAAAVRGRSAHEERTRGSAAGFRQGLLSNLANPKMAVFFTSLLPQFGTGFGELLTLGLLFSAMTLAWLSVYALAVARTKRLLVRGRVRRALDAVTGLALVAFGARLAAER